jgi:hypothetical protein
VFEMAKTRHGNENRANNDHKAVRVLDSLVSFFSDFEKRDGISCWMFTKRGRKEKEREKKSQSY